MWLLRGGPPPGPAIFNVGEIVVELFAFLSLIKETRKIRDVGGVTRVLIAHSTAIVREDL